jgi:uncharacterized protein YajQ (UPF0234 family)
MPSFDIVSEVDLHELNNAIDQSNREVITRFDFKGSDSKFTQKESEISLESETEFQLQQMMDILQKKMVKRGIDIACLDIQEAKLVGKRALQKVIAKQGVDKELARKIVKDIKASKLKVQVAIQGEQVRVTGKKRDDLQQIMALMKQSETDLPLQFTNFRD